MTSYGSESGGTPQGAGQEVICPNCKGGNAPGTAYCTWCGTALAATIQGQTPGVQMPAAMGAYAPPPVQPQQAGSQPFGPGYVPTPGGAQVATTGVPPKRRSPLLIIGGIVLGLLLLCGIGAAVLVGSVFNATQPMANTGEAFMTAARDGNWSKAYDMSSTALQQEAGNAQGLQTALSSKPLASWSFTSRNISNGQGTLSGTTNYTNGTSGTVDMVLNQVGNDWKVAGVSLK